MNETGRLRVKHLSFGFLPGWWVGHYGVAHGERYYTDPEFRMRANTRVKHILRNEMRELLIYDIDPADEPANPDYGNATSGAFAGCEVSFPEDGCPTNKHLPEEKLAGLKLPEKIEDAYPYNDMIRQVEFMNKKYGRDAMPVILPRGVLNEAFLIAGGKILTDMLGEPEEARRMLDFSYGLLEKTVEYNARIGYRWMVRVLNCTVQLISPAMYEEWLLPYDQKICALAEKHGMCFGIHHCGLLDPVMDLYRKIPRFAYLQMGFGSDIQKAFRLFPEADLHYIIDPVFCVNSTPGQVAKKMGDILAEAGENAKNLSIGVGALDYGTPMENLIAIKKAFLD